MIRVADAAAGSWVQMGSDDGVRVRELLTVRVTVPPTPQPEPGFIHVVDGPIVVKLAAAPPVTKLSAVVGEL